MSKPDNAWLHAGPASIKDAWFITISGFDACEFPHTASFLWPIGPELTIPNRMVLMTAAAFADLQHRAQSTAANTELT